MQLDPLVNGKHPIDLAVFGYNYWIHVVMGGKALGQRGVDGFEFIFVSSRISGIVAFTSGQHFEASAQDNLQEFAAVVLKNIIDAVCLPCYFKR